ncbi:MAG: DEAD/DEAH box helicase family protein, partial [Calditrichota bacterium]
MKNHFEQAKFKYPWRPYQKRVLDELETHLEDDRLHVVAPPGSGKTVLGLEIMRRIGQPALALAPSLTIRNQWVERFTELFLQLDRPPEWISTDIDAPAFLTVATYQSIHSIFNFRKNQEKKQHRAKAVLSALTDLKTHTLIVDEAHHLQKEWWKSLDRLRNGIGEHSVVALTATPPYDVSGSEWERYIELCGPIDAEICIPEMMLEESLCPHQDFIYFSPPTEGSQKQINQFYEDVDLFIEEIKSNASLILLLQDTLELAALAAMDQIPPGDKEEAKKFIKERNDNYNLALKEIAGNPEFYFSLLIFLNEVLPEPQVYLCRVLEIEPADIPPLDKTWLQTLLSSCIYDRFDFYSEEEQEILIQIRRKLRKIGAIENKRVNLEFTDDLDKVLLRDPNKLRSIIHIVAEE